MQQPWLVKPDLCQVQMPLNAISGIQKWAANAMQFVLIWDDVNNTNISYLVMSGYNKALF